MIAGDELELKAAHATFEPVAQPLLRRVARSSRGHGELCGARAMCRCKNEPTRGREPAMTEWGSHPVDPRAPSFGYARQCLPSTAGEQISSSLASVRPPARRMWWVRSRRRGEADNGSLVQRLPRDHNPRHDGNAGTVSARGAGLLSCCGGVPCSVSIRLRQLLGARTPPVPRVQGS